MCSKRAGVTYGLILAAFTGMVPVRVSALPALTPLAPRPNVACQDDAAKPVVDIRISLSTDKYMVGEPIVLTYTIVNASVDPIRVQTIPGSESAFVFEILDSRGRPLRHRRNWAGSAVDPLPFGYEIGAKYKMKEEIVVNRWVAPGRAGNYTLIVNCNLEHCKAGTPHPQLWSC